MKKNETKTREYRDVFNSLESLYLDSKYEEVIQIRDEYQDSFLFDESKEEYSQIIEIFSASYIELDMFNDALTLINKHIEFIKDRGYEDSDGMDDLSTLFQFKIIIYQKRKAVIKEYRTIKEYISIGGTDQHIIDNQSEVEDIIFHRFFLVNKILIGLTLLIIVLRIILPSTFHSSYISIGTSLIVIWVLLIHIFHKRTRQFLKKFLQKKANK